MFVYVLQFMFYFKDRAVNIFVKKFFVALVEVFRYSNKLPISSLISVFVFVVLLTRCFGGYFTYSFCPCGILNFTLVYAFITWIRTLLTFIRREKFSIYISKSGDNYLKTFVFLAVESIREFSRPIALTIRLTVNIIVGHLIRIILYQLLELTLGERYIWLSVLAIIMECFVFLIQRYVFSRLIFLYLNE